MDKPAAIEFVTVSIDRLREIIRDEVAAALGKQPPPKLVCDIAEAATRLNLPESWIASAARAGMIPSIKFGHYVRFRVADLEKFLAQQATPRGTTSR